MLPQYMALSTSFVRLFVCVRTKTICVSVRWVTLWVCYRPVKMCVSVRWGKLWGRTPLCENMCVRSLGYIVGASPPVCVCSIGNTVGASPPCVGPFIGRQSSLDPCMLPTPLCGIF